MNELHQTFPATLAGLASANSFLEEQLETSGCSTSVRMSLMVAFDEVASNIVHYSKAPDFKLVISFSEGVVRLVFTDSGAEFDPLKTADPDITLSAEERDIGGLGLLMVKRMMDEVSYAREGNHNILTLLKKFA